MLNIEVNRSAEGVERYFDRELAVSDYLMKEPGIWAGRGAERLELRGPIQRSQFIALLRNENPTTGKRLTARMNTSRQEDGETVSNRQVGYGLVFGVPKSLSIYLAITGDQVVENIARSAVDETIERGDALLILEQSASVRYVELLQTQRQKVPALKAAIEDLKAGRLQAGWEKLEHFGVIKEVIDEVELRQRAVEQHLEALRVGKTSLMISPRHEEARKVAAVVRQKLKAEGAIGAEDHAVTVLRRMDLGSEACRDLLHYAPGRVVGFHSRTAGGFRPGEKWTVRETNCETVTLESNGMVRQFKPSAKGKWDVLVSSTMQLSVGDQIRVTAGFREGKNVFKNNDVAQVREITNTELVLHDGRRMRRDGARIDQGVCITSHASQCRTVDQVVALPDGADAKGWYVSLSRARAMMHVYTRNKTALRQSVMQPGERKSVWELLQAVPRSKVQSRDRMMPDLWATRQAQIIRAMEMER
jgi:hypothetical protein